MSHDPSHGATTIRAKKGGGGGKVLLAAVAVALIGGAGYFAWKTYGAPQQPTDLQTASYADEYGSERAGPLASDLNATPESLPADEAAAPAPAERRAAAPARPTQQAAMPEETIGVSTAESDDPALVQASATVDESEDVVVTAPRRPVWARVPTARRLAAMYPQAALERGREGEARLHCTVLDGGALDCVRAEETSRSFGSAALRVANSLRHAPRLADGSDATGSPVNLRVVFRIADEQQRRG